MLSFIFFSSLNIESCCEIYLFTVFREEYMPKLDKARREIEKRVAGLEERKTQVRILCFKISPQSSQIFL